MTTFQTPVDGDSAVTEMPQHLKWLSFTLVPELIRTTIPGKCRRIPNGLLHWEETIEVKFATHTEWAVSLSKSSSHCYTRTIWALLQCTWSWQLLECTWLDTMIRVTNEWVTVCAMWPHFQSLCFAAPYHILLVCCKFARCRNWTEKISQEMLHSL